jgi:hypothetical protein
VPTTPGLTSDARPAAGAARALLVGVLLLALSAGLRLYHLEADAPIPVLPGYEEPTAYRDEPAKAHEARKRALFGSWQPNPADQYQIWRRDSPVWVYGQYLWFEAFGVSYASARALVVLYALGTIALLFGTATARYGLLAGTAATVLLGFNFAYLQYTRLALMEPAVLFFLVAAAATLSRLERHPRSRPHLAVGAALLTLAAALSKPSALPYVPLLAAWAVVLAGRRGRRPGLAAEARVTLGTFGAVLAVLGLLFLLPAYAGSIGYHVQDYLTAPQHASLGPAVVLSFLEGLRGPMLPGMLRYLAPVALALAAAEAVRAVIAAGRSTRRRPGAPPFALDLGAPVDGLAAFMLAWLAVALLVNLAGGRHHHIHLQLPLLPPAALLGGLFAARLWHRPPGPTLPWWTLRALVGLLAVLFVLIHGARYYQWARQPRFSLVESGRALRQLIGDRPAVVVGEFAVLPALETPYECYFIRPGLINDARPTLLALGITHLVAAPVDMVTVVLARNAPEVLARPRILGDLEVYGLTLRVYELVPAQASPR